ncbi:MAG: hypothetical protein JXA68_06505 [Ignavibacteriales bacterium]|nr:hypothetical protein [Ignavibacteriales bacterium]
MKTEKSNLKLSIKITLVFLLFTYLFIQNIYAQDLLEKLKNLPGVEVKVLSPMAHFQQVYEIMVEQPIDHNDITLGTFKQQIYLYHYNEGAPMIFNTEGYNIYNYVTELASLLQANQISVEHRYFGKSVPEPFDWKYLNIKKSAGDHHHIVELFKQIYEGKWVGTGISKGGQTSLFHRRFYPNDVDVSVPYVAPLNLEMEDARVYKHLKTVSSSECRDKILKIQRVLLEKKDDFFPMFVEYSRNKGFTYEMGDDMAYDYAVFEYSFAFWQWQTLTCEYIPSPDAELDVIFNHWVTASSPDYFSDASMDAFRPFFYQAYTEVGYYGYETEPFKDILGVDTIATNKIFAPQDTELDFDISVMQDINNWFQDNGNYFIFIYGEYDTWTSTSVNIPENLNSLKMVNPEGSHGTRILSFPEEDQEKIFSKLEEWLDIEIERPN